MILSRDIMLIPQEHEKVASLSLNAIQSLGAVPQNVNYAIKSSFIFLLVYLLATAFIVSQAIAQERGIVPVPIDSSFKTD